MNFIFPSNSKKDTIQSRLFLLAALFLFIANLSLTLAPTVRYHSWNTDLHWKHWAGFFVWLVGFSILHRISIKKLPARDNYILPVVGLLIGLGLTTIWRLNSSLGLRQTAWISLGFFIICVGLYIDNLLAILKKNKTIWLVIGLSLVALTFFFGTYPSGNGPALWLKILGLYIQPSEPLKLILIIFLSAYLAELLPQGFSLKKVIIPTALVISIAALLLVFQKDLGTSYLVILNYCLIIYISSGKKRILFISAVAILIASIFGFYFFDVIRLRVESWINPWADPSNRSYQIIQSMISIASGGLLGQGLGLGNPGLVPLAHSDFIFTSISEEMGLLGSIALLSLYSILGFLGIRIALKQEDSFLKYLSAGSTLLLISQVVLILGGNLRLLPLTGVTLPFVSYGGSSLMVSISICLILLLISNSEQIFQQTQQNPRPYLFSAFLMLSLLSAISLLNGWWGVIRSKALTGSPYNARPSISDRYVPRGDIVFRNGKKITTSIGQVGDYQNITLYPALNPVIGYTQPFYGSTGLQESLSPYLQGIIGYPREEFFIFQKLYSQTPPGLDVRISIDPYLQANADRLLGDQPGAILLLDAYSGEILVMASHPYFDVNDLAGYQDSNSSEEDAPLLNRNTQGSYPPGTSLLPFLLANTFEDPELQKKTNISSCTDKEYNRLCFTDEDKRTTPDDCIDAGILITDNMTSEQIKALYRSLGFDSSPDLSLPSATPDQIHTITNAADQYLCRGDDLILVTPVQMAIAAASLSENGRKPAAQLALAYRNPDGEWIQMKKPDIPQQIFSPDSVKLASSCLAHEHLPIWKTAGHGFVSQSNETVWYLAGTLHDKTEPSLALVVVLEKNETEAAKIIGDELLSIAIQP